jgi:hypothetical protein
MASPISDVGRHRCGLVETPQDTYYRSPCSEINQSVGNLTDSSAITEELQGQMPILLKQG